MESTTLSNIRYKKDETKPDAKSSNSRKHSFAWDSDDDDDDRVFEKPQKEGVRIEDKIDGLVDEMQTLKDSVTCVMD